MKPVLGFQHWDSSTGIPALRDPRTDLVIENPRNIL
jgi:hypothetical protein